MSMNLLEYILYIVVSILSGVLIILVVNMNRVYNEKKKNIETCTYAGTVVDVQCSLYRVTIHTNRIRCRVKLDSNKRVNTSVPVVNGDKLEYCSNTMPHYFNNHYRIME